MIKFDVWMSYEENMNVHVLIHVLLIRHPNVKLVDVIELTAKGNLSLQKIICIFTEIIKTYYYYILYLRPGGGVHHGRDQRRGRDKTAIKKQPRNRKKKEPVQSRSQEKTEYFVLLNHVQSMLYF